MIIGRLSTLNRNKHRSLKEKDGKDALIRAVLFDFWDTLVFYGKREGQRLKRVRVRGLTEALVDAGFSVDSREVEKALEEVDVECDEIRGKTGQEVDLSSQVQRLMEKLRVGKSDSRLSQNLWDFYAHSVLTVKLRARNGAASVLGLLKEGGYKVGLVCNTYHTPGVVVRKVLQKFGLFPYFDALIFSDEYGLAKPRPEIFLEALSKMGVESSEAVHIGDRPDLDVLGAKKAGLKAIHLQLTDQPYPPNLPQPDATIKTLLRIPVVLTKL
jgi:putative hydrolase of the HAD superfamily